ncbi:phosphoenolpyruvate--protein phosphotransferase [Candidatus Reidiella endopervernicosa]|uniref:Phosphoenolpyruvate-protein phosphotransferase n=1 Tax=Candidatus Reidiella endopervernicosa TaxID=2738883 RepID=A0A6N0HUV5_9GAMM|nr:phosphoenolpyruvate--protein phosphotransferase [Candidatus Reidiella endopervernicosa]QKQ26148.1 phosphoenolpyruvate--protein phosphotransferase [Candidatus Reidiella endopervernicosa]
MSLALNGIGVSRGIAIGKVHLIQRGKLEIPEYALAPKAIEAEVERFTKALQTSKQQLQAIRRRIPSNTPTDIAAFIDTHLLMLDDAMLRDEPIRMIRSDARNAEWALKGQRDALVAIFDQMDDPYLRTRKDDVEHVISRIMRTLLSHESDSSDEEDLQGAIIIADDLTPADTVLMQSMEIAAFITESGGPLSHTAILARSLQIPAIVGCHNASRYILDGDQIIIDGKQGAIIVDPDARTLKHYRKQQREQKRFQAGLAKLKQKPAITLDGRKITLLANAELPEDIRLIKRIGADGIGLFRTEFLYMNRSDTPNEEQQFEAYHSVVKAMKGQPVTIRTLDLGADKEVDGCHFTKRLCSNPALGLRAIRLCLNEPGLFRPQLRAILRASASGAVRIMLPMISTLQEVIQTRQLIEQVKTNCATGESLFCEVCFGHQAQANSKT